MSDDRLLYEIHATVVATKTDVDWIKKTITEGRHEQRIGSLEKSRGWLTGLAAGIGALLGVGTGHLPKF